MNDLDLSPKRASALRRAQTLARKINLLLDTVMTESGQPFEYPAVRDAAKEAGYYISRTRWSMLKAGREQAVPEECLRAVSAVFDVDPEYLLQEDGNLPEQVEAELALVRSLRRAEVRNFAARSLGPVDPKLMQEIARLIDESE